MKVIDFLKGNKVSFGINCLVYFEQHENMDTAWDKCDDPLRLIAILKCLSNSNYDLPIVGFLVNVAKTALQSSDNLDYKRLLSRAVKHLEDYSNGVIDAEGLRKAHQDYELKMRQVFQENAAGVPHLSPFDKRLIYGTNLSMLWLFRDQESSAVHAAYYLVKTLPAMTHEAVAILLKDCVGNPFLT